MGKSAAGVLALGAAVFCIEEGKVTLTNKNERLEKHGEEDVLACDLEFCWPTDNGMLACFHPALKFALYEKSPAQGELIEDSGHLTHLRFPYLNAASFKWGTGELVGAAVLFHAPTKKGELELADVKVNNFRLGLKEGGTVDIHFRVQMSPLDAKLSGRLSELYAQKDCIISVTPAGAQEDAGEADRKS